jgi:hypothetical protein
VWTPTAPALDALAARVDPLKAQFETFALTTALTWAANAANVASSVKVVFTRYLDVR